LTRAAPFGLEGEPFILKEDKTPTSIGGELRQVILGGSPIFFQDKASQQVRLGVLEEKCDYGLVP
ncbi:hypothetical protein, partial [Coprococcus catus]|uniref:hypothetical protein n=1 Tax=Coprococcus catus TaxID=116085 RepID=UPI003CFBF526